MSTSSVVVVDEEDGKSCDGESGSVVVGSGVGDGGADGNSNSNSNHGSESGTNTQGEEKTTVEGDEEETNVMIATPAEMMDPAILAVSVVKQFQYSKERLLELREAPLSRRRPEYLDPAHNNPQGIWDPERWHHDWKRAETPNEGGPPSTEGHGKRRSGDPKERIRKEQDGIVLSPQRRSFNTGCFVPVTQAPARGTRPDSPLGVGVGVVGGGGSSSNKVEQHLGHRDITSTGRRIGSGRILSRDVSWDYRPDKSETDPGEFGFRSGGGERNSTGRDRKDDDRFERRSFGRDFEKSRNGGSRYGGGNERRRISDSRDEEPEWFSGGPTSQADTIELRGFEDAAGGSGDADRLGAAAAAAAASSAAGRKKKTPSQKKRSQERAMAFVMTKGGGAAIKEEQPTKGSEAGTSARSTSTPTAADEEPATGDAAPPQPTVDFLEDLLKMDTIPQPAVDFLEDLLKMDTIPEQLLTKGSGGGGDLVPGSRFSRWFTKGSPQRDDEDPSSEQLVSQILNGASEAYFAPISPAAPAIPSRPVTLLDVLHRTTPSSGGDGTAGKVLSLEELEARMRQQQQQPPQVLQQQQQQQQQNRSGGDDDMAAFKRLLAQVSGGQAVAASNGPTKQPPPPLSLMQMLSRSQQQEEAAAVRAQHHQQQQQQHLQPPHVPNDLVLKLHQVQQHQQRQAEMLSKLMSGNQPQHQPRQQQYHGGDASLLLQRPEAQAIIQGLKRGDITPQHLLQQLAQNPAMQPRHREMLLAILKYGPQVRDLSPAPPPPPQQQQQQLRVSPLPPSAYCVSPILATSPNALAVHHPAVPQRIPSPRELQAHTQNIMQRALIKKKLEEQQENYRKKQELQAAQQQQQQQQQRSRSPSASNGGRSPAKHMASPTPLAFTPTSVLRKMTADKEAEKGHHQQQQQGRALTAARGIPQQPSLPPPPPPQQQQQQQQQQLHLWPKQQTPPAGRPIVKGNANFQFDYQLQQQQQQRYQQHRQQKFPQSQPRAIASRGIGSHPQQQQLASRSVSTWQQLFANQPFDASAAGMARTAEAGDLSPTSDQLARWFSPELLAQARAGKLPNMPPPGVAQSALSLEELERLQQSAAPVHN